MNTLFRILLANLLISTTPAFAQDDGQISGTLRNEEGRVLANITVLLRQHTDPDRLFSREHARVPTDGYGRYDFTGLEDGSYLMSFIDENYLIETYNRNQFTDTTTVYGSYAYGSDYGRNGPQTIFISDSQTVQIEDQILRRYANNDGTPYSDNRLPSASVTNCSSFGTEDEHGSFAAALANAKTINFECSGTLVVPEIVITKDTAINGMPNLILSGGGENRIVRVLPGIKLDINQLQLSQGNSTSRPGGAIYTLGYTSIIESEISRNSNAASAGGIYNRGQLTLSNTSFVSNISNFLSALENHGQVIGNGVYFSNHNSSYSTSVMANYGKLAFENCTVGQSSSNNVFAIENAPGSSMSLSKCSLSDNSTSLLFNKGSLTIKDSEFSDNTGDQPLIESSGVLDLMTTSINNNRVGSTMVFNTGLANIVNTTISTNSLQSSGDIHGAALQNEGTMKVSYTTITKNKSFSEDGDQIINKGEMRLSNSIIAENGPQCSTDYYVSIGVTAAPIISDGYNLFTEAGCAGPLSSDIVFGNAGLGALKDNGGYGATHGLLTASDAKDNGSCNVNIDQRGISRPQGGNCDIGALEAVQTNQSGICSSTTSDPDGDGWGWENGASCRVAAPPGPGPMNNYCSNADSDTDNDGWGWENNSSCRVRLVQPPTGKPVCSTANADPDGDGWGWENGASCRVQGGQPTGKPVCSSTASDPDGDGWGWENGTSCRVT